MSRPLRVALLQLEAYDLAGHELAWAQLLERIDDAAADEPDLIVLPEASYPAYFLGSIEEYEAAGVRPDAEVLATLGERARRHGCHIAAGLVLRREDGGLENACVLFDPQGAVMGRYAKSFLWHFDRHWFSAGDSFPVFRIGEATVLPGDVVLGTSTGVIFIPPHLAQEVVERSEAIRLQDQWGQMRLRESKYTPGQVDGGWTDEMKADFAEWSKSQGS